MQSHNPTISVVIPAYNRETTIRAAIESVLQQTWTDYELLVIDDCSRDGTVAEIAQVSDPRVRLIKNARNMGAAGARNVGVGEARGFWIAFQDSDDEWLPRKLEKQMARVAALGDGCLGVYCGLLTLGWLDDGPGERLRLRYMPPPDLTAVEGDVLLPLLYRNMISTQTLVVRRETIVDLGSFDEETTPIEDWDFVIRLAERGAIAFVDEPLVQQRFSPNSITRNVARRQRSLARLVEKNADVFAHHPKALAHQYYGLAGGSRQAGDFAAARRYLAQARKIDPGNPRAWAMSAYVAAMSLKLARAAPKPD